VPYQDDFGRAINYLRVSITDRCNLRCVYCMPAGGVPKRSHSEILRYEEFALVIRAAAEMGVSKVRITGGEPLARAGLADFVHMVATTPGIQDLSLTTNGTLLARQAAGLAAAGLHRINISLDTLRADRFEQITRGGRLVDVFAGIAAAQAAGLHPIKLNMVVIRGLNDDEIVDFVRQTVSGGWHARFIEFMPVGDVGWRSSDVVPIPEIRERIEAALGRLEPVHGPTGNGPARYYRVPGTVGTVGFIGALSEHFCAGCNRLRLTADGRLRPCLMSSQEIDLREPLRNGAGVGDLKLLLEKAIQQKPRQHHLDDFLMPQDRTMAEIGG